MRVAIIGGGAAGFFSAISAKTNHSNAEVVLFEKTDKLLAKVRISGGGRCNVTHACHGARKLASNYPRGERFLRKAFEQFAVKDTVDWFAQRNVDLKTELDGRMFPTTDDSRSVITALMDEAEQLKIQVRLKCAVIGIERSGDRFQVSLSNDCVELYDRVIVTTGGSPKPETYSWLKALGHTIVPPAPSLFTFNMPADPIRELMGVVVPARVRIIGTDVESKGPLLITHWGMSGPAILRASAWGARVLQERGYNFSVQINWLAGMSEDHARQFLTEHADEFDRKQIGNANPFTLPKRFWSFILNKAGVSSDSIWSQIPKKDKNRMIDLLTNDRYEVRGKTTFKEEFVTAGGISLEEVSPFTMQSTVVPELYFAGEVLDIDGITGGFNFQAAWTTGHIAGLLKN